MFNTTFYGPFVTLYSKDIIKLPAETIQRMMMYGGLFAIFFNILWGHLTHKIGSRKALIVGILGHVLFLLFWLYSKTPFQAVAIYVPCYLFLQLSFVGHDTLIIDLTQQRTRTSIIGIISTISGIIGASSPYTGTILMTSFNAKFPFFAAVIYGIFACTLLMLIKLDRY
jgi:MFS family permease